MTDAYLEDVVGEDVYRQKIKSLRKEEDILKRGIAGNELRQMERERSETYLNQVKNFLLNYDGAKKKIDFSIKKEMCFLLFKNMTIGPAVGNASPWKRVTFSLFDPFNFLFLESKEKQICQKNQRIIKASAKKSTSVYTFQITDYILNNFIRSLIILQIR